MPSLCQQDGSLIRPRSSWSEDLWDPAAEDLPGVSRPMLDDAPPAHQVAAEVHARIKGRIVVSDAPDFDGCWLELLAGERFNVEPFGVLAFKLPNDRAISRLFDRLARMKVPHRAGPDSARLPKAWLLGLQVSETPRRSRA